MADRETPAASLRLRGGFDLSLETSSLRGCELRDAWLDLRVPLERDAAGNYGFAEGNWRVSVGGRGRNQPAEEPKRGCVTGQGKYLGIGIVNIA